MVVLLLYCWDCIFWISLSQINNDYNIWYSALSTYNVQKSFNPLMLRAAKRGLMILDIFYWLIDWLILLTSK